MRAVTVIKDDAPTFGRVITAMVTPFNDELEIDYSAVESIVNLLIETGSDSVVVAGTTGESPTLEDAEKKDLLKSVISIGKGKLKIIMGTGYNSTTKSIRACKEAEELGADALLVVAPYYNKPNQEGLLGHFSAICNSTSLPVIVYNIPGRTGVNVNPETILELSKRCPNLHALKDSTGNVDQAAEIASKVKGEFHIYSGDDYLTLPFLSIGACGVVSVASHLVGSILQEMIGAFFDGQVDRARHLHLRYLPLFKGLFAQPNPTCVKYALSLLGLCKPSLRQPLSPLSNHDQKTIQNLMKNLEFSSSLTLA